VVAGYLQFERPHERWKLYRGYQRTLEVERMKFENSTPYDADDAAAKLALRLAELQLALHDDWGGITAAEQRRRCSSRRPTLASSDCICHDSQMVPLKT
jgi:hypothetical protein